MLSFLHKFSIYFSLIDLGISLIFEHAKHVLNNGTFVFGVNNTPKQTSSMFLNFFLDHKFVWILLSVLVIGLGLMWFYRFIKGYPEFKMNRRMFLFCFILGAISLILVF